MLEKVIYGAHRTTLLNAIEPQGDLEKAIRIRRWAISPLAHGPAAPEEKTFLVEETDLKRRTDERQNTQRENTQQRSDSAHTCTQPTQLTLLENRLQPTTPLAGQGGSAAHCSMYPGE